MLELILRGETQVLEAEHPELYRRFTISRFVVRYRMASTLAN